MALSGGAGTADGARSGISASGGGGASIIPSYPKKEGEEDSRPFSYTDLQKIAPLDMLRHTFTNRFGGDLPEELEKMFNDVVREVSL